MAAYNQTQKILLYVLVAYKYIVNTARIWFALLLLFYGSRLSIIASYLGNLELVEDSKFLMGAVFKFSQFTNNSVLLFSLMLFTISGFEVVFLTALLRKRKWGLVGLITASIIWLPLEIKLLFRLFSVTKFTIFTMNILVILFLLSFARNIKYFKKQQNLKYAESTKDL